MIIKIENIYDFYSSIVLLYNYDYLHGDVNDYEILKFREFYLAYLMYRQKFFIRGHFTFSQKIYNEFKNDYCFITILRDPVKKWLSNYYYRKNRGSGHWKIDLSLKEYIDSELALVHGYDYSKYFGGKRKDNNYDDVGHIERAKKALENFKIIGFLEHLDDFQNMLNEKFNYNFKIPHKNISKNQEVEVPLELKKKIEKICKVDIEIYDFAIKRFRKQK